jgi:hypothetical protein
VDDINITSRLQSINQTLSYHSSGTPYKTITDQIRIGLDYGGLGLFDAEFNNPNDPLELTGFKMFIRSEPGEVVTPTNLDGGTLITIENPVWETVEDLDERLAIHRLSSFSYDVDFPPTSGEADIFDATFTVIDYDKTDFANRDSGALRKFSFDEGSDIGYLL